MINILPIEIIKSLIIKLVDEDLICELNSISIKFKNLYAFQLIIRELLNKILVIGYAYEVIWIDATKSKELMRKSYTFPITNILVHKDFILIHSENELYKLDLETGEILNKYAFNDVIMNIFFKDKEVLDLTLFNNNRISFNSVTFAEVK